MAEKCLAPKGRAPLASFLATPCCEFDMAAAAQPPFTGLNFSLDPCLTRIGPSGWHGSETDVYDPPAGTAIPQGVLLTDPGASNGCCVSGQQQLELVAAGARDGRYRYHPLRPPSGSMVPGGSAAGATDALGCTSRRGRRSRIASYPYLYYHAADDSWNLRAESGTAEGGTIAFARCGGAPHVAPVAGCPWESYFGALREPHPLIVGHTGAYSYAGAGASGSSGGYEEEGVAEDEETQAGGVRFAPGGGVASAGALLAIGSTAGSAVPGAAAAAAVNAALAEAEAASDAAQPPPPRPPRKRKTLARWAGAEPLTSDDH